ncbi:MAG: PKD domain-containing protein [Bacteroidales bacterium]|nr:PKD domain-containing protein [Bacteroidales bacterium]
MKKHLVVCILIFCTSQFGKTQTCNPPTNANVSPLAVTTTTAPVTWSAPATAVDSYVVSYKENGAGFTWQTINVPTPQLTTILTGLTPSTTYILYVHSICGGIDSDYSNVVYFKTASACYEPTNTNVNPNNVTTTTAPVTWSAPASTVSGYVINYKISGPSSNTWTTINVPSTPLSRTITGLTPSTTYILYVHTDCGTVESDYSNAVYFTTDDGSSPTCEPPRSLGTSNLTETSVTFNYASVAASTKYEISYRADGAVSWSSIISTGTQVMTSSLDGGSYYEWKVRSYCSGVWSTTWSTIQNFHTPCPNGASPHLNFVTENSAEVDWNEVKIGAEWSDFNVYYRILDDASWTSAFESGYSKLLLSSLQSNTPYEWYLETICPSGILSEGTTPQIFTTSLLAPISDFALSTTAITEGETVNFTDASTNDPTSYLWTFNEGTPSSSTEQNPSNIIFNTPGYFNITLQVTNSAGTSSITKQLKVFPIETAPASVDEARNRDHPCEYDGDPVNTATGEYTWGHEEMVVNGMGMSFPWKRYYASRANYNNTMGWNWNHNYDIHLTIESYQWTVHHADGGESTFIPYENGSSLPLHTYYTDTMYFSGSIYTLEKIDGTKYQFDNTGKLTVILFSTGQLVTLEYDLGNLSKVTFPGGRYYSLSYTSNKVTSVTDNAGRTVTYAYDGNGDLISGVNVRGGTTQYTYSAEHWIETITDPLNNIVVNNTYDAFGKVISQSDALNNITTFQYDTPVADATTVTDPSGADEVFYYDSKFRLIQKTNKSGNDSFFEYHEESNKTSKITDEKGRIVNFTIDNSGNITQASFPMGVSSSTVFDSNNLPTQLTNPLGDNTNITYNADKNPTNIVFPDGSNIATTYNINKLVDNVTDPNGNTTSYEYNSFGDVNKVNTPSGSINISYNNIGMIDTIQDRNGNKTTYNYDDYGNATKVTDPMGFTTNMSYDLNGNLISEIDKNGTETQYIYDTKDRLSSIDDALGNQTQFTYNTLDQLISVTNAIGNTITYTYTDNGQVSTITDALGTISYTYDDTGIQTSITDALSNTTTTSYDLLDRATNFTDALGNSSQINYNNAGQVTSVIDAGGNTTQYFYDELARITKVIDPLNGENSFTYDSNGNLLTIANARGNVTQATYNNQNFLLSKTSPAGNINTYSYDNEGNLIEKTDPNGEVTSYTLDANYQLSSLTHSNGAIYTFVRNNLGQPLSMTNTNGTINFQYNVLGWISQSTDPFGQTIKYLYDEIGRRTNTIYPENDTVIWEYNTAGLIDKISDWKGNWSQRNYDAMGNITDVTNSNETSINVIRDNLGRPTSQTNMLRESEIFQSNVLTYNAQGNITQDAGVIPLLPDFKNLNQTNTYDTDDRLLSSGVNTYSHNTNGTRSSVSGTSSENYTWGENDLLLAYTHNGKTTQNEYNTIGVRTKRTFDGIETRYTQDIAGGLNQLLEERNSANQRTASYVYAPDGLSWRLDSSENVQFYHFDYAGHTIALTDSGGVVTDTLAAAPFGDFLAHNGNTQQPFAFLGRYGIVQEPSDLYHVRARFYDASIGRFISKDVYPANVLNTQSINRFAYSLNNPVGLMDVTGFVEAGIIGYENNYRQGIDDITLGQVVQEKATDPEFLLNTLQVGLDGAGLIPGLGEAADGANALIYLARGDKINAGLSTAAMIPLAGMSATVLKYGNKTRNLFRIGSQFGKNGLKLMPLGIGSTGRGIARNLTEHLALKEIMSNPTLGIIVPKMKHLTDSRWAGWRKMQYIKTLNNGTKINIHYVGKWENNILKAVDDFKFK